MPFSIETQGKGIAISTRIRLARNVVGFPFPNKMNIAQKKELTKKIYDVVFNSNSYISEIFEFIDAEQITDEQRFSLAQSNLVSFDWARNPSEKSLLLSKDNKISVMINEEDHLRIQSFSDEIDEAFDLSDKIDIILNEKLTMAYHPNLGYLTPCPTNLGTALRASVMLHLPAFEEREIIEQLSSNLSKLGFTIRGSNGEGTKVRGSRYQISNQITLGLSESESIENLTNIVKQIISEEIRLREFLLETEEYQDKVFRAIGTLKCAKLINKDESENLISMLRIAVYAGIVRGVQHKDINNAEIEILNTELISLKNNIESVQTERKRALILNNILKNAKID